MPKDVVIVTEKASASKELVKALIPNGKRGDSCFHGDWNGVHIWITQTNGHLYTVKEPKDYDSKFAIWRLEDLPFPVSSEYKLIPGKEKLAKDVIKLIEFANNENSMLIMALDPDEQACYIFDLVLRHTKYKGEVKYSPILALDEVSLKKQFSKFDEMDDFSNYIPLVHSEEARAKLDAHLGYNVSRAHTVSAQKIYKNIDGNLVCGRIQSPILGLVGRRHYEIQNFTPSHYYNLFVNALNKRTNNLLKFKVIIDRVKSKDETNEILDHINKNNFTIESIKVKKITTPPPDPYKQDTLQIELNQQFGYTPKQVLDAADSLYKQGLSSYPRTDSTKVLYDNWCMAAEIMPDLLIDVGLSSAKLDYTRRGRSVTEKNQKANVSHTALLPTGKRWPKSEAKKGILWETYKAITTQYSMMFMIDRITEVTKLSAKCGIYELECEGDVKVQDGWYEFARQKKGKASLPPLTMEDTFTHKGFAKPQSTKAPSRYSLGDITKELANISNHLSPSHTHLIDAFEKAENPGLGSAATRADTIDAVFKHKLVALVEDDKRKVIELTKLGKAYFDALPETLTRPDVFAEWENDFRQIAKRRKDYNQTITFRSKYIDDYVKSIIINKKLFDIRIPQQLSGYLCPKCNSDISRLHKGDRVEWLCIHCQTKRYDFDNGPLKIVDGEGSECEFDNCKGTYEPYVGMSKKFSKEYAVLRCNICRKSKEKCFLWGAKKENN